jgi:hypothetical protein
MKTEKLTLEQLIELVKVEADNLKNFASKEECNSNRAFELIEKSCMRVTDDRNYDLNEAKLNGKPKRSNRISFFTPIETFIGLENRLFDDSDDEIYSLVNQDNGNNKILIDYIKGKRKTLKFKKIKLKNLW